MNIHLWKFFHADTIRKLFSEIKFSEKGTNERENEERAFMYFVDYLEDCESGMCIVMQLDIVGIIPF